MEGARYRRSRAQICAVKGRVALGRWLLLRRPDGRYVWPQSRTQSVLGASIAAIPLIAASATDAVSAQRRLLAFYAEVARELQSLPPVIRRPPGRHEDTWWMFAPAFVVRALVSVHVRRRATALGNALVRAALLADGGQRQELLAAGEECQALAKATPRTAWLTILATVSTGFSILSPLFPVPKLHFASGAIGHDLVTALALSLFFGVVPLLVFFNSVSCKRRLFGRISRFADPACAAVGQVTTYELEQAAFSYVGTAPPDEWESRPWIRWLTSAIYLLAILIPLIFQNVLLTGSAIILAIAVLITFWLLIRRARRRAAAATTA